MNATLTQSTTQSMNPESKAQEIVRRVLNELCIHTENIEITTTTMGSQWQILCRVHKGDLPRVLGKQGVHFRSLNTIVQRIGQLKGRSFTVQLLESVTGQPDRYGAFEAQVNWNSSTVMQLLSDICDVTFQYPVKVELNDGVESTSQIEILADRKENGRVVIGMKQVLQPLFNAIGRRNGRILFVDVRTEGDEKTPSLDEIFGGV